MGYPYKATKYHLSLKSDRSDGCFDKDVVVNKRDVGVEWVRYLTDYYPWSYCNNCSLDVADSNGHSVGTLSVRFIRHK